MPTEESSPISLDKKEIDNLKKELSHINEEIRKNGTNKCMKIILQSINRLRNNSMLPPLHARQT